MANVKFTAWGNSGGNDLLATAPGQIHGNYVRPVHLITLNRYRSYNASQRNITNFVSHGFVY